MSIRWVCADEKLTAFPKLHRRFELSLITFQHFAADNSKAGSAAPASDKQLATFGNCILGVVVAFLRMLSNGYPHSALFVHIVNVYLCQTRVFPTATRLYANTRTIGEVP